MPEKEIVSAAEKLLYKKTAQEDMYLYLLRPEGKSELPRPAIVYFTGGAWVTGGVEFQIANAACTVISGGDESGEDLSVSSQANALVLHNPALGEGFGAEFFTEHPEFSPILNVYKGWPPTILSCGTVDGVTPFSVAQKFVRLMKDSGNTCELIAVKDADHSCDWPVSNPNFLPTMTRMTQFLHEQKGLY